MRDIIISELKIYFKIQELVGQKTFKKFGDDAWQFFQTDALHCLLILRKGIGASCTINTWHIGGNLSQRGLRTNLQQIFKGFLTRRKLYLSGHVLGCGFDCDFFGWKAEDVRDWAVDNEHLFPCKIRFEHLKNGKPISWVHFDTKHLSRNPKVYLFNI